MWPTADLALKEDSKECMAVRSGQVVVASHLMLPMRLVMPMEITFMDMEDKN
jgi:hypothetical protein